MSNANLEVLIAVDFGTTFSGLCWALKDKSQDHNLVQNLPGDGASHNKTPTNLQYSGGIHLWGYEIREMGLNMSGSNWVSTRQRSEKSSGSNIQVHPHSQSSLQRSTRCS